MCDHRNAEWSGEYTEVADIIVVQEQSRWGMMLGCLVCGMAWFWRGT